MSGMTRFCFVGTCLLLVSCGPPPPPPVPSLTPQQAGQLLHYNNKAQNWLKYVRKQNPACDYRLDLPDQSSHPASIDLNHIVICGAQPSQKEFDATVSFAYDRNKGTWVIEQFSN
jgi:hypothetical protein